MHLGVHASAVLGQRRGEHQVQAAGSDALRQGVEILLSGHNHFYARFAPQDPNSVADLNNGLRQFTVGTGGVSHSSATAGLPNLQVQNSTTFGVLELALHSTSYDFNFVPDAPGGFGDTGSGQCTGGSMPAPQAPAVVTGSATGVGPDGATLTGTVNPQGAATTYHFEYGISTSYGNATTSSSAGSAATAQDVSAALTGLSPSTTYHYRVVATNTTGTTNGDDRSFTTGASTGTTPGPVTLAKVLSGSTTDKPISVTVKYNAASGAPTGYRISVIDQSTGVVTGPVTVASSALRTKISGLESNHTYQAQITAFNTAGDGPTVPTTTAATAR
ncbi:MAG: fibronectin type III domain-containing protein [Nocardioidaceae bacterium]